MQKRKNIAFPKLVPEDDLGQRDSWDGCKGNPKRKAGHELGRGTSQIGDMIQTRDPGAEISQANYIKDIEKITNGWDTLHICVGKE